MKPLVVCAAQPVASTISAMVAPSGRRSISITSACFVPSRILRSVGTGFGAWLLSLGLLRLNLDADGGKPRVGDDQREAVTLVGLAPDGIAQLAVGLHLLEEAFLDQGIDDLVRRATLQALGQGQGEAVGALRCGAEDDALGVGEFCHGSAPWVRGPE